MAATANKLPALADLLSLLPTLHSHWVVAANSRHFACRKCAVPWGVTNTATAGCMDSQSVKSIAVPGERVAMTRERRSTVSSVTSWWTPWGCSWLSCLLQAQFKIAMARAYCCNGLSGACKKLRLV
jgi:hypothetical protein